MKAQRATSPQKSAIRRGAKFVAATLTTLTPVPRHILPTIVAAQLTGTSLSFAGNAAAPDPQARAGLTAKMLRRRPQARSERQPT